MAIATPQEYVLVDPTTAPQEATFRSAPRLQDLVNKRVGIIDDSKENAQELLEELVAVLRQQFGVAEVVYHRKPSASKPAAADVIHDLARTCDYALVAIGS
ncbi:MAG: hypothetical protein FJZ47_18260 [Candidatus Tectomicrobia bacterium]|uniref:UGSC-like domain-containing protein n=1 Tax=Tectimicrobiota bacterium TaxID=2528274 RepID=A0A937W2I3_UNCTE|nr:hypothetical protein [Candidatus Tectomicrobia bacterium]